MIKFPPLFLNLKLDPLCESWFTKLRGKCELCQELTLKVYCGFSSQDRGPRSLHNFKRSSKLSNNLAT